MNKAKGVKVGTTHMITKSDARKLKQPESAARAEFCNVLSTVLMSEVNRLSIRPMGVTSKKREGAPVSRLSMPRKSDREASKLE